MNPQPLLSVIIPNWNGKHFLTECIDSLKEQTFQDFEILLVDNGSTDGSADFAEAQYGEFIRVLRNKENLGFAGGNNIGIRKARGEYIVLLNNDTWADPRWLEELVKATQCARFGLRHRGGTRVHHPSRRSCFTDGRPAGWTGGWCDLLLRGALEVQGWI